MNIFSFSFDYAFYSFFVGDPSVRHSQPLPEGISQFQKPMVTSQEYSSTLLNRLTRIHDSSDEIGFNFAFSVDVGQSGSLVLNSSYASRTKEWYRKLESDFITSKWKVQNKDYFLK